MKCEIRQDGTICITPETELEAYAIKKWCNDNMENEKVHKHILIMAYETNGSN